jgi:hypothetical protein
MKLPPHPIPPPRWRGDGEGGIYHGIGDASILTSKKFEKGVYCKWKSAEGIDLGLKGIINP